MGPHADRRVAISRAVIIARDPSAAMAATTEFDTWSDPLPSRKARPRASPADHAVRDSRTALNVARDARASRELRISRALRHEPHDPRAPRRLPGRRAARFRSLVAGRVRSFCKGRIGLPAVEAISTDAIQFDISPEVIVAKASRNIPKLGIAAADTDFVGTQGMAGPLPRSRHSLAGEVDPGFGTSC